MGFGWGSVGAVGAVGAVGGGMPADRLDDSTGPFDRLAAWLGSTASSRSTAFDRLA